MIRAATKVKEVDFEYNKLELKEYDYHDDLTSFLQIRLEGGDVLVFIHDSDYKLHSKKMTYTEFKEKLTEMIDDPKTGRPI